jgi:Ca2+-binding EF-hand superfamily protein
MSKKDIQAKDLQTVLAKDVATKNPIFSNDSITELHSLFSLYADPRQRRVDVKDILMTAKTLGLDARYDIVFRVLLEVSESSGDALNFEEFLKAVTARIVFFLLISGKPIQRRRKRSQLQFV